MDRSSLHTVTDHLAAITGPEYLRIEDDSIGIFPASSEQISAILRFANENNLAVTPYGAGTKQHWGDSVHPALMVHMRRLNLLRDHTWQDMTATVQAGCAWSSMQSALARHGQFVALDPLWPDHATVGGVVATNDSGGLRLKYGSLRDLVIGMTVVLADGTIAHTGGKVVKNVAGYDLHKLMIRAFGTLGIVTEVTFRLHAIPQHVRSFTITSPAVGRLGGLLLQLLDSHLSSQSIQLRAAGGNFALDIRLSASPEALDSQAVLLRALSRGFELAAGSSEENAAWQLHADRQEVLTIKATMLPSEISRFAEAVDALGGTSVTQAVGIMMASLPPAAAPRLGQLRLDLEAAGGSLVILSQPAGTNLDPWGTLPDSFSLMREIKNRFDPHRILNPGRFLGGI